MKHLVIYAHPNPASFNHAILETTVNTLEAKGHEVVVRDLYALGFQPVLTSEDIVGFKEDRITADIQTEQEFVAQADVIILIYPIWWAGLPAIIKGYIDRVFAYGFAYKYGEQGVIPLLTGKKGLIVNTQGSPKGYYDQIGMTESLRKTSDNGIFTFVGIEPAEHLFFGEVPSVDDAERKEMLESVKDKLNTLF